MREESGARGSVVETNPGREPDGGERRQAVRRAEVVRAEDAAAAAQILRRIGVHPGGVAIMARKAVFRLVLLRDVDPRAANIIKQEMLARGGDAAVADSVAGFSPEPTDVLLMGTLAQYDDLVAKLRRQPYYGLPGWAEAIAAALGETSAGQRACNQKPI